MNETRVIVHAADPEPLLAVLATAHQRVQFTGCDSYAALPGLIDATRPDVVFTIRFAGTPTFPGDALLGPMGPRWISVGGSGVDHLGHWDSREVTVTNAAGVAADMMAEYVFGGLLHFTLDVPGLEADRANRRWAPRSFSPLAGRTLLVVGLGNTGQAVAARAKAFGMTVIGTRARPQATAHVDEVYASVDISSLWERADAVVVCAPLVESTRGLLDDAAFAAMNDGVLIIDVSRGGLVDTAALMRALRAGKVSGAVLDVFEAEPLPPEHPLWTMDNVLLSPHCSSVLDGWEVNSIRLFSESLSRFLTGEPLSNVVDPARGY